MAKLRIIISLLLILAAASFGQKVVIVDITYDGWTDTGVDVIAGERLTIISNGFASTSGKTLPQEVERWGTPAGSPFTRGLLAASDYLAPQSYNQTLVGKISSSGKPFYVGENYSYRETSGGRLYLGYNDQHGSYTDNFGYFVSFIFTPSTIQTSISEAGLQKPVSFSLEQNFPNPFNAQTEIRYDLTQSGPASLKIFNAMGQEVATVLAEHQSAGEHVINWDGRDTNGMPLPSGQYYYQLVQNNELKTNKMILIK